jgi:cell wall assembly regulator SMI1
MRILEVIEEIRVVLREEFDVDTQQNAAMSELSLTMLKSFFPLLPADLEMLYKSYKEQSLYDSHSGEPNCDWLLGSIRLIIGREITKLFQYRMHVANTAQLDDLTGIGPIKPGGVWRSAWMPLTEGPKWFFVCDMDPAPGGYVGQIVYMSVEDGIVRYVFKSITEMLEVQLGLLKSGKRDIFEAEDYFT